MMKNFYKCKDPSLSESEKRHLSEHEASNLFQVAHLTEVMVSSFQKELSRIQGHFSNLDLLI